MAKKRMLPFAPELSAHLGERIAEYGYAVDKRKMFGHEVYFLNGYMFAGANRDGIFVHVGTRAKEDALRTQTGVFPFEPMEGTVMREYLLLGEEVHSQEEQLRQWLETASAYLQSLPPKTRKSRQKKTG
jgi:TfoX/Sxy family transcriptional regulator of competence genes